MLIIHKIISVLIHIILVCLVIASITYAYLAFTIRPRFEKLFHDVTPIMSSDSLRWGPKVGRFHDYVFLMSSFPSHKNYSSMWYRRYKGFNFPAHCSKFEMFNAKLCYFVSYIATFSLCIAEGITLYFQEQHKTDLWHYILNLSVPTILTITCITILPYFYLELRIPPRFKEVMHQAQPELSVPFNYYLRLMANYTVHKQRHTYIYEFLKPCDLIAHVSHRELLTAKFVYWMIIVLLFSLAITLPILFMRTMEG